MPTPIQKLIADIEALVGHVVTQADVDSLVSQVEDLDGELTVAHEDLQSERDASAELAEDRRARWW